MCTPLVISTSSRSPASITVLRSRPVPGTGIRWWWIAKIFRSAGTGELLADPVVALAADLPLVEVGLGGVRSHDPHALDVVHPVPRAHEILEVEVADVAGVVVAGDRQDRRLDALPVGDPVLVLLAVPLVRQVAGADDHVRRELVELGDDTVHQVRHEVGRADVRIGDVGDRDHVGSLAPGRAATVEGRPPRSESRRAAPVPQGPAVGRCANDGAPRCRPDRPAAPRGRRGVRRGAVQQLSTYVGLGLGLGGRHAARPARRGARRGPVRAGAARGRDAPGRAARSGTPRDGSWARGFAGASRTLRSAGRTRSADRS